MPTTCPRTFNNGPPLDPLLTGAVNCSDVTPVRRSRMPLSIPGLNVFVSACGLPIANTGAPTRGNSSAKNLQASDRFRVLYLDSYYCKIDRFVFGQHVDTYSNRAFAG